MEPITIGLGAIGLVTSIFGAYQQGEISQEQMAFQRFVADWQMRRADEMNEFWKTKYKPLEEMLVAEIKRTKPYEARYDEAEARAVTGVRREFAQAREMARRCIDPRCVGMQCFTFKELAIAEARASVGAINKGFRAEEARKDTKDAQRKEEIFSMIKIGKGLNAESLNALNGASRSAQVAGSYRPYQDITQVGSYVTGQAMQWYNNNRVSSNINNTKQTQSSTNNRVQTS